MMLHKSWKGLTLMEFLISVVIVAALIITAIPTYKHYSKKAFYSDLIQATFEYQTAVTQCINAHHGNLTDCNAGHEGIPKNKGDDHEQMASITVVNGVIT